MSKRSPVDYFYNKCFHDCSENDCDSDFDISKIKEGSHILFFYNRDTEVNRLTLEYIKLGFVKNQLMVLVNSAKKLKKTKKFLSTCLTKNIVNKIYFVNQEEIYFEGQDFSQAKALAQWQKFSLISRDNGYNGIFVIGNYISEKCDETKLYLYENAINEKINSMMTAICAIKIAEINFKLFRYLLYTHSVIIYKNKLMGNVCYIPPELALTSKKSKDAAMHYFLKNVRCYNCFNEQLKKKLDKKEIAIEELLDSIDYYKQKKSDKMYKTVEDSVLTYLNRLKLKLSEDEQKFLDVAIQNLEDIFDSSENPISKEIKKKLTEREQTICDLISKNFSSKDIAYLLQISYTTVNRHRNTIRKKLELTGENISLTDYLNNQG